MVCYHPLKGWKSKSINPGTGKRDVVFDLKDGYFDMPVQLPCGQCIGCRLERSRQWAVRCVHESKLYEDNCFITLTYNDENIPKSSTLIKKDFQDFMKRLRKAVSPKKIRFFHCGEYGDLYKRPHYHAIIFNHDFVDKKSYFGSKHKSSLVLNKLWNKGYNTVGEVNFNTCAYVARYIMKKVTGEKQDEYYKGRLPEYTTMSRRPGIGKNWFDKYYKEFYNNDCVFINGKKVLPPKFYDSQFELIDSEAMRKIKNERVKKVNKEDCTIQRLVIREKVVGAKNNLKRRDLNI